MSLYKRLESTVSRLLKSYGYDATLTRSTTGSYDPATGRVSASSAEDTTARIAVMAYASKDIDGSLIKVTDKKVICSVITPPPRVGDSLFIDGLRHSVVRVDATSPAGVPVMYELQCRA